MATATKTTPKSEYTLCLTQDEAQALFDILGQVKGEYDTTRRKYTSAIFWALERTGLESSRRPDLTAEIQFV